MLEVSRPFVPVGVNALDLPSGRSLRGYQLEGINWLLACWHARRSAILADEMGLGKTCQLLLTIEWLANNRRMDGPVLIVAPVSTLGHWQREVHAWTGLSCAVLHGPAEARKAFLTHECRHTDACGKFTRRLRFHVLITAYDTLCLELTPLSSLKWQYLVVDEAHRLKNPQTKLVKALHSLHCPHTTLLTGTPVQNNVPELLGLISFLDPVSFSSERQAELLSRYGDLARPEQVEGLQSLIRPYVLRRTKEELSQPLPAKRETLLKVSLTPSQMRVYRSIMDRSLEHICNPRSSLRNVFMQLRKACNHPLLLEDGSDAEQEVQHAAHEAADALARLVKEGGASEAAAAEEDDNSNSNSTSAVNAASSRRAQLTRLVDKGLESLVRPSGKMVLLDKLLPRLRQRGHKVLIFSQFAMMLDLIEEYLSLKVPVLGTYQRVDGGVTGPTRQRAIDAFQSDEKCFAFLLTTRAGGQGINLTAADTVILFDSDWNPQGDNQGQARAHRIGQERGLCVSSRDARDV